jgi:hypothetical protein
VDLKYLFGKHVLPIVGNQPPRQVTFTSLKLLLNKLAADGYGETSVGRITTYIKACFEYATDEKGEARIGRTKTKESDSSVPVPPDLSREIAAWIAAHPERTNPRAFLFEIWLAEESVALERHSRSPAARGSPLPGQDRYRGK